MVRADVAARKVARADAWLRDAEEILRAPRDAFVADAKGSDLACFYLFLAIQECIDLAAHWVSDAGYTPPDDAAAAFDVLAAHTAIPADLATRLHGAASLRNRIAHGYHSLDRGRVHDEAAAGIGDLRRFLAAVAGASRA